MAYQPIIYGVTSLGNSTVTNIAANGIFTGASEDVTLYSNIKVNIFSSHVSAIDGLQIQQSSNNINWDPSDVYTIPATTNRTFSVPVNAKFHRIVYTNGATLTTEFRLQVTYHTSDKQPSSVRPQDGRANDNDFVETLGFLMGYNSISNAWNRLGITNAVTGGNENLIDRLKVNAALRMLDNAQPSGSKLVNVTGTQALGLDTNPSDRAARLLGVITAANLDVALSTRLKPADTLAAVTLISDIRQATAANLNATVTQQAITKATQGTTGVTTQDLKDAGRSARTITLDSFNVAVTAETLMTMSFSSDNGTLTTGTSYTVTTGKRFRLQSIIASTHTITGNTTLANVIVRVRANNVGAALISSPIQFIQPIYGTASVNQAAIHSAIAIPDGWEFIGGAGIGITVACAGFVATTAAPKVNITIIGYEY